jgi:hypothetical protein
LRVAAIPLRAIRAESAAGNAGATPATLRRTYFVPKREKVFVFALFFTIIGS